MYKLDISDEEAFATWCYLIRARKEAEKAVKEQNFARLAWAFGWMDDEMNRLAKASVAAGNPIPDGSESGKP